MEVVPVPPAYTVIIDYAHSPNALENILTTRAGTLPPGVSSVCLAAGETGIKPNGPLWGAIAQDLADVVVVTSDNPRTEDPQAIITDILSGMEGELEKVHVEPDRPAAIGWALSQGRLAM